MALKVLKPELAVVVGTERFLAEIETTANLTHPHILPLHDSGEANGFLFYVMPYLEGENLADRIDRETQLPVDEAVALASRVAGALQYAHERGVIHRDIKPGNILLHGGEPVVADFGIALALGAAGGDRLTATGLSMGTPQYMSPEQAAGDRGVGPPTDVYALGCVLYEMLVGEPPYTGTSAQAILAKIIVGDLAPVTDQRGSVPTHVAAVVAKALEKVAADRFESGGELARSLGDTSFRWPPEAAAPSQTAWKASFAATLAVAVVALLFALRDALGPDTPADDGQPTTALSFFLPQNQLLDLFSNPTLVFSPDGSSLVYAAEQGVTRSLYVREVGSFSVRALEGTDGARGPFFSPDGQSVGFFSSGALRRVPIEGGIPTRVAEVSVPPERASWGDDGTIIFAGDSSLWRVPASSGTPVEIPIVLDTAGLSERPGVPVPANLRLTRWPNFLPGADRALLATSYEPETIGVVDPRTGRFRPILRGDRPYYLPSGHIVFYSGRETVSVAPFDLESLEVTGPAVPIVGDALRPAGSRGRFAVSKTGTLAYLPGGYDRQLVLVDRNGRGTPLAVGRRGYRFPEVSPDGRYIVVTVSPQNDLWAIDLLRETAQPFTDGPDAYDLTTAWSPDGTRLAFYRNDVGSVWVPWPAGGEPTVVSPGGGPVEWTTDNEIFARVETGSVWDLTLVDVETGITTDWLVTPALEGWPAVSPDGAWVAYASDVSDALQVYVRSYLGDSPTIAVSIEGGTEPQWSADGTEIFFLDGNTIMAVPVRTNPTFEVTGSPVALFTEPYDFSSDANWDVLPDDRFLMIRSSPNIGREVRIMTGWLDRITAN